MAGERGSGPSTLREPSALQVRTKSLSESLSMLELDVAQLYQRFRHLMPDTVPSLGDKSAKPSAASETIQRLDEAISRVQDCHTALQFFTANCDA